MRWVNLTEAAVELGITEGAVRRRIKRGVVQARLIPGLHGQRYEVQLEESDAVGFGLALDLVRLTDKLQAENQRLAEELGYCQGLLAAFRVETARHGTTPAPRGSISTRNSV